MQFDPSQYSVHTSPGHLSPQSFQEQMADQLRHAPWLVLSILVHGIALLIVMMIPAPPADPTPTLHAAIQPPPEDELIEPPEPPPEPVEVEDVDEPILADPTIEPADTPENLDSEFDTPFDESPTDSATAIVGLGVGHAGPGAGRRGGRGKLRARQRDTAETIEDGLEWLKRHQDADGKWDADDFMKHDEGERCDGPGNPVHDVGITALALLAYLGDGSTLRSGPYRPQVKKAVLWLRNQQREDGLFGTNASHDFVYDHALATLAIVEAYGLSEAKLLRENAQLGIAYLEAHRNPYRVWRYQPRDNDNDTSVTGWCVMAYKSAADFDLEVNSRALDLCRIWFDEVTDPETGRCGYSTRGELSSRVRGDHGTRFPPEKGEALTAIGLMSRFFLGQDPAKTPVMKRAAKTILSKPPVWDEASGAIDHYYWYYATYALYQMGGSDWRSWEKPLHKAVVKTQRKDGNYHGSWDPSGAWGEDGGRVYSTALLVLTLEAYYRYTRVFVR